MASKKHPNQSKKGQSRNSLWQFSQVTILIVVLVVVAIAVTVGAIMKQNAAIQQEPTLSTPKQYNSPPPLVIDIDKEYQAIVKMTKGGEFVIQLYPDKALTTVNSFVFLARDGYFDGVTFHRVLEGFMAQTGDPTGKGTGGPGYTFMNEESDLLFDKPGVVAMANTGRPNSNGSQFFITFVPTPQLNGGYTIFGQVISGMDVVNAITRRDPQLNPDYIGDEIESITIIEK